MGSASPQIPRAARIAFRIAGSADIQKVFVSSDTLLDVMYFVISETRMRSFVLISQYPPLHIDSIYLSERMYSELSGDEKSNEAMYEEVQATLSKSLYELNMVPSCRVMIRPSFEAKRRGEGAN